jgi:hypothetical protein
MDLRPPSRHAPAGFERLSALPDGRLAYRMKRASLTGETHLVLPPVAFLRRVAALVPPPGPTRVRYFGVAPNARVRPRVVPAPLPPAPALPETAPCPGMFRIPPEGLRLILGVDRLLDMCRTTLNVVGDLAAAVYVARGEPAEEATASPSS